MINHEAKTPGLADLRRCTECRQVKIAYLFYSLIQVTQYAAAEQLRTTADLQVDVSGIAGGQNNSLQG